MLCKAALFDLDGVISDTANAHAKAWKVAFDEVLAKQANANSVFLEIDDYLEYIDGKTRLVGIKSFLRSRKIDLPFGGENDTGLNSIHGIGNTKNTIYREILECEGVKIFGDSIRLIERLQEIGIEISLVSSSKNAWSVLEKGGMIGYFKTIMDGTVAQRDKVASKPDPAYYRHAAALIDREPQECVVVEDAVSGVVSAKQAGMFVIGVARSGDDKVLRANGADMVVFSLDELTNTDFNVAADQECAE